LIRPSLSASGIFERRAFNQRTEYSACEWQCKFFTGAAHSRDGSSRAHELD